MAKLVSPTGRYEKKHQEALEEDKKQIRLGSTKIRQKVWWLVEGKEFIGRISLKLAKYRAGDMAFWIRPSRRNQGWGKKILKLGLAEAKKLGKKRVTIYCRESNIASKKVIKANGGKAVGRRKMKNREGRLKFTIDLVK